MPETAGACPRCGTALASARPAGLSPGTRLDHGRYVIDGVLGCGGFGITYLATHRELQQRVAIKEFFPSAFADRDPATGGIVPRRRERDIYRRALACFIREGRLLAGLDHRNIVRVMNLFQERHTAYLVMELIDGDTLAARLRDHQPLRKPLVRRIMAQLVDALAAIHRQGICHLDIKPDNIMLTGRLRRDQTTISAPGGETSRMSNTEDGRVVLLDFGAARQVFAVSSEEAPVRFGTPASAPPEMLRGEETGPESDIFEVGGLLYLLLTGVKPPPALERLSDDRWTADGLPEPWRGMCASALQLDRRARPRDIWQWWNGPGSTPPRGSATPAPTVAMPAPAGTQRVQPPEQDARRQEIERLLHKADSLFLQDHEAEAIAAWRRVLTLDPANETARRGIDRAQDWLRRRQEEEEPRSRREAVRPPAAADAPAPRVIPRRPRRRRKGGRSILWISLAILALVVLGFLWPWLGRRVITKSFRQPIPYQVQVSTTGSGSQKQRVVTQKGANGVQELTVRVTYNLRGAELKRETLRAQVIRKPKPEVVVIKLSPTRQELLQQTITALFTDQAANFNGTLRDEYRKNTRVFNAVSRGLAFEQQKKYADAERAYREAVAAAEQRATDDLVAWQPYLHLGRIHARQGKYEQALDSLQIYYAAAEWTIEGIQTEELLPADTQRIVQTERKSAAALIGILQQGLEAQLPPTYKKYVLYTEKGDVDGDTIADTVQVVSPDSSDPYIPSRKYFVIVKGYAKKPASPKRWADSLGANCQFSTLVFDNNRAGIHIKDGNEPGFALIFTPSSGDFADFAFRSGGFVSLGGGL